MFSKHNRKKLKCHCNVAERTSQYLKPFSSVRTRRTAGVYKTRVHVMRSAASKGKYLSSRVRKTHNPPPRKREPWLPRKLSRNAVRTLRLCAKLVPQREGQIHKHHHRAHVSMSLKAIIENAIPNRPTRRTTCREPEPNQPLNPRTGELTEERQPSH